MKKRLAFFYVIAAFLVIVIIVLAINKKDEKNQEKVEEEKIQFESGNTISLYRSQKGQIENVDLNYYLLCVVASEMPFKYEYEALKAQAVVARTYLLNKMKNNHEENGDVCDSFAHCQAFNDIENLEEIWKKKGFTQEEIIEGEEKIKKAVVESDGEIITYNNEIINALFHASSPVRTENASAIWGQEDVPYLKAVENEEDEDYERRESTNVISYETFKNTLIDKGYVHDLSKEEFLNVHISEYTESGRVKSVSVGNYNVKAESLRTLFGINSTNFTLSVNNENIEFHVLGFGHGVGMSQVGANKDAKSGKDYKEIIHHYYTDVEITNVNN